MPDRGTVAGVMWYFPAEHEVETLPLANTTLAQRPIVTFNMTQQDPAAPGRATQQPQLTQLAAAPSGMPLSSQIICILSASRTNRSCTQVFCLKETHVLSCSSCQLDCSVSQRMRALPGDEHELAFVVRSHL